MSYVFDEETYNLAVQKWNAIEILDTDGETIIAVTQFGVTFRKAVPGDSSAISQPAASP